MEKAVITFANGEKVEISEDDYLLPVSKAEHNDEAFASQCPSVKVYAHIHDGLIPAIADVLCCYSHFYVNHNMDVLYSSSAVVKIERL